MRIPRKAAVLLLLGLSFGTPGAFAAKTRSEGPPLPAKTDSRSALHLASQYFLRVLRKAGCTIGPWGQCGPGPSTVSHTADAGCTINPLGGCGTNSPSQILGDSGCTIDPLGHCLPGH
jgi:hypothetical protein